LYSTDEHHGARTLPNLVGGQGYVKANWHIELSGDDGAVEENVLAGTVVLPQHQIQLPHPASVKKQPMRASRRSRLRSGPHFAIIPNSSGDAQLGSGIEGICSRIIPKICLCRVLYEAREQIDRKSIQACVQYPAKEVPLEPE